MCGVFSMYSRLAQGTCCLALLLCCRGAVSADATLATSLAELYPDATPLHASQFVAAPTSRGQTTALNPIDVAAATGQKSNEVQSAPLMATAPSATNIYTATLATSLS